MTSLENDNLISNSKSSGSGHMLGLIENVDMSEIRSSRMPIREDEGDLTDLTLSIKEMGLLHPIVVRILDNRFEVVAGNRRYLACKKLGWRKIPSHVVDLGDRESFEVSMIENVQRKTMNPIEEANAYSLYIQNYGWGGVSELAKRIGKSQEYVSKRIKLLDLPREIQDQIIRRRIKSSIAEEFCYVKDKIKLSRLVEITEKRQVTVKKFREMSRSEELSEDDLPDVVSLDSRRDFASFDKLIIVLKLTLRRIDEILNTETSFVVKEIVNRERTRIHSQIDFLIISKKKYSKLIRSNGMQWLN